MPDKQTIIGRFAPSPTGPLHLGSLYTALASFLQARSQQGRWHLRLDDLDTPRNRPDAVSTILNTLDTLGLHWDGSIIYQSQQLAAYQEILEQLWQQGRLYRCDCSRKMLSSENYSGRCRHREINSDTPHALRLKTQQETISFDDYVQGLVTEHLVEPDSDFIVKRKDGIIAYQFAVVIDDYLQGITEIVRGCDLLTATPKQIYLQRLLHYPTPHYLHVPVIIDQQGFKLSKQTFATAVDTENPAKLIFDLLKLLKQQPPLELKNASLEELLQWGICNWKAHMLQNQQSLNIP